MNFLRHGLNFINNIRNNNNNNEYTSDDEISSEDREEMERRAKNGQSSFTPFNKTLKAEGSKAIINFLLGKHLVLIFAIILFILIIFIVFVVIFSGSDVNTTPVSPSLSKTLASHTSVNITIIKNDDDEDKSTTSMSLEDYVKKALTYYASNLDISDDDGYNALYAMAISLRTEAVKNNFNVTFYGDLNGSSKSTKSIDDAVSRSEGIVLVEDSYDVTGDGSIPYIKTSNTFFNWDAVTEEGYHVLDGDGFYIETDYVTSNLTNEMYVNCPANYTGDHDDGLYPEECWEEKEVEYEVTDPATNTTTTETETEYYWKHVESSATPSFSMFGAYYLSREKGYSYSTLLYDFYGEHIRLIKGKKDEKKTNSNSSGKGNGCTDFDLHDTTLGPDEFVEMARADLQRRIQSSGDSNGVRAYLLEGDHLKLMYEQSLAYNLNPEFSYAKAIAENSPGPSKHNYWGVGCYNGEGCARAKVYTAGYEFKEYAEYINRSYKDFDDILMRYQQIGEYWYNPGSSDAGGCYYAKSIYPDGLPDYVAQACAAGNTCTKGVNQSNCVKTTDEDQYLYGLYVSKTLFNIIYKAFGIDHSSSNCTNTSCSDYKAEQRGSCVIFAQTPKGENGKNVCWANDLLGNSTSSTISKYGCTLTSIAIAATCSGKVNSSFSPATLNNALKDNGGFSSDMIYWGQLKDGLAKIAPGFEYITASSSDNSSLESARSKLITLFVSEKYSNVMIVAKLNYKGHWVLIPYPPGENDTEVTIYDPAGGKESKEKITNFADLQLFGWND